MLDHPAARWVIQQLLNGNGFYLAIAMISVAAVWRWTVRDATKPWRVTRSVVGGVGLVLLMMTLSFLDVFWVMLLVALGVFAIAGPRIKPRWGHFIGLVFLASLAAYVAEFKYATPPADQPRPIVVYGDSLSAPFGIAQERTWSSLVGAALDRPVDNRAVPGNRVTDVLTRQRDDPVSDATVFVLIGGNDQLGGTPALEFAEGLGVFIRDLREHRNQVIVIETPVTPTRPHFGWLARVFAEERGVAFVPRRAVADALFGSSGGSSDGLHLSEAGHAALAKRIFEYMTKP